jgi:hypothetical protein
MSAHVEAYLSGSICGPIWWPSGAVCGRPLRVDLHGKFRRFSEPASFRDVLESVLMEEGGDFQSARFSADTELVFLRKTRIDQTTHQVRVRARELVNFSEFSDLVDSEHYTSDFMGYDDE